MYVQKLRLTELRTLNIDLSSDSAASLALDSAIRCRLGALRAPAGHAGRANRGVTPAGSAPALRSTHDSAVTGCVASACRAQTPESRRRPPMTPRLGGNTPAEPAHHPRSHATPPAARTPQAPGLRRYRAT